MIDKNRIYESIERVACNYKIAEYYEYLYQITDDEKFINKCRNISNCYKYFDVDYYNQQKIVDIKRISLCHDKFCKNCQNILSKQRYVHFKPYLDELSESYDLYHVTFTVPNCNSLFLGYTLDKMYFSFAKFINYLRRKDSKHTFLNLNKLGYQGCIRSLEISYTSEKLYHPHFHCIFVLRKDLFFEPCIINKFSYDKGVFKQMFTELEIEIQKVWYLIYNNIRLTEDNYNNLPLGYSCTALITNYDYKEVFKYTLKETFDVINEDRSVFQCLQKELHKRRVIQGYGCLFNINTEEDVIAQEADYEYLRYIEKLWDVEEPKFFVLRLQEIIKDIESDADLQYISRKTIKGVIEDEE